MHSNSLHPRPKLRHNADSDERACDGPYEVTAMKILINESERFLHSLLLKWGHQVLVASDSESSLRYLQQTDHPNLAILNSEMKGLSGIDVCRKVREEAHEPYVYFILLTNTRTKDDMIDGLESGADDYVMKPFDGYELRAKLQVAKRILGLQDQLISMREELRAQATHDSMTGLWNRAEIVNVLLRELQRADRQGHPVGVVIADLDYFKKVNDTYGHLVGDAVLREVANRMVAVVRPYDSVGRYGGEEFLIVSPGAETKGLQSQCERIRQAVSKEPISLPEGNLEVTVSLGAAVLSSFHRDSKAILRAADEALYRAKRGGRDRVELADSVSVI